MKILHLADVHYSRENQEPALRSLETILETVQKENVDLVAIAGDLFDRAVTNTDTGGLPALHAVIRKILDFTPIVAVAGTPTHDVPGCYDIFEDIQANHSFTLIKAGETYFLDKERKVVYRAEDESSYLKNDLLILGCHEPSKAWLLAQQKDSGPGNTDADRAAIRSNGAGDVDAAQAVIHIMKALLLGYAAVRKQNSSIPCLFLYHGNVTGSTMCNNQLLPETEIRIGKDDLALIGADYYALGHIHLYQELFPNAYYSGSVHPVNWGELDQKSFNLVELGQGEDLFSDFDVKIQRRDFPHYPMLKLVWDNQTEEAIIQVSKNFRTWIVKKGSRESLEFFDLEEFLKRMLDAGACPGSKITIEPVVTEMIRAQEIQTKETLPDKVDIWAEYSSRKITPSIKDKALVLEQEAHRMGFFHDGAHIRIRKLILQGARGTMKKAGKKTIEINFDELESGIIAFIGQNGAGKSTIIENCHPYLSMLTRSGTLKQHFWMRDSFRDLYFRDERSGIDYRALIEINAATDSGGTKAFLYKFENGWIPYNSEITGIQEPYEKAILELWGSKELFLKSAFQAQKSTRDNKDLTDNTQSENKILFTELAGLDYFEKQSQIAKGKADELEKEITKIFSSIQQMETELLKLPVKRARKDELAQELKTSAAVLKKLADDGQNKKIETEASEKEFKIFTEVNAQISGKMALMASISNQISDIEWEIEDSQAARDKKEITENKLKEMELLKKQESDEFKKISEAKLQNADLKDQYAKALRDYESKINHIVIQINKIEKEIIQFNADVNLNQSNINNVESKLSTLDEKHINCPTCGQDYPEGKKESIIKKHLDDQDKIKASIICYKADIENILYKIKTANDRINALNQEKVSIIKPAEPQYKPVNETALTNFKKQLSSYNEKDIRDTLEKARDADVRIKEGNKKIVSLNDQKEKTVKEIEALQGTLNLEIESKYQSLKTELENLRTKWADKKSELAATEREHNLLKAEIEELNQKQVQKGQIEVKKQLKQDEYQEWRILEEACGKNGIQALELDALAPSITEIANRLLEKYDSRFKIEIRTTRIGGKGKKQKQIEDFSIWITDSQDGSSQELSTLSGGEMAWVKRAIYDAFSIIREKNTGVKFLTVFQDEADGALHPDAKHAYLSMLKQAHVESKRYHTIIITHSEAVQESIAQKIDVAALKDQYKEKTQEAA